MKDWAYGIDVGGTRTKMGLVHLAGGRVATARVFPTEKHVESIFWATLKAGLEELAAECALGPGDIAGAGLGIGSFVYRGGGTVDSMCGFIDFLDGVPVGDRIRALCALPCVVDNDVRAIALAESRYGAGAGAKRVLTLTLGTGVGVCLTVDGHFTDAEAVHHLAGHLMVRGRDEWEPALDEPPCYCALPGCMESTCSGTALQKLGRARVRPDIGNIELMQLAAQSEPAAKGCLDFYFAALERGLNQMVYAFSPDRIVLGGGITKDFGPYLGRLNAALTARVHSRQTPEVVLSRLEENGGILGAALLFGEEGPAG